MNDRPSGMIVEEEFGKQRHDDVKKDISTDVASTNRSKTMVCFVQRWYELGTNIIKYLF